MDENTLHSLASQRSQECQLMDLTLGRLTILHESELAILDDLYREDRWRWTPEHGLQVGLPQDSQVRWFSRESVWDLQNRVRPLTLPDGDPDPNTDRRLERQEYVWLLSQMLHYKLGFALTPIDAVARIATALRTGNVQQPRRLKNRAQKLREEYQAHHSIRNTELQQRGSAVTKQTSRFDNEPEEAHEREDGASVDGNDPVYSTGSGSTSLRESENIRTGKDAVAVGSTERDTSSNASGACLFEGKTTVTVSAKDPRQAQVETRSNLSNPAKMPWVSHFQTLLKGHDPLPPEPRLGLCSEQNGTEKPLITLEQDAQAPSKSNKASSFETISERVKPDSTKSFTAGRSHESGSSVDTLTPREDAIPRQNRTRPSIPEGIAHCPGDEPRTESFQSNVLPKQREPGTSLPRTVANYLTVRGTGPRISEPGSPGLFQPQNTALSTTELEQVPQPRSHPPIYIVIEDSDSEQQPGHSHRAKETSLARLKRRKPFVKVAKNLGTSYPGRSIFSLPRSDIDGGDSPPLFSRQRSLSSAPSRISAKFPQIKRSTANSSNKIKNRIPAAVCSSTQDVLSYRGNRQGMQSADAGTVKSQFNAAIVTIPGKDPEARKATSFAESAAGRSSKKVNQDDEQHQSFGMVHAGSHYGTEKGVRRRGCESGNIHPPKMVVKGSKKDKPPKKAKSPGQHPRMTETTLTDSDIYAPNGKVDGGWRNIDKAVDELRHSSQTFARNSKTPRKTKRSHSAAFNEVSASIKRGTGRQKRNTAPCEPMKGTTSGAPKSPIPRADDVTIFPRFDYLMGCDENGVPAKRAPFRRPTPLTHTIRNQVGDPLPRENTPLEELLKHDQERRRRDPKAKAIWWNRFPKPSPWRSGRGIWHKPVNSARLPFRGARPKRSRTR